MSDSEDIDGLMNSIGDLRAEVDEKSKDLEAFSAAREIIRRRVIEVKDSDSRLTPLPIWAGTDAVLGSLDLAIHSMERTVDELKARLNELKSKRFELIEGGRDADREP